jgi:hypothetical protein
MSDAGCAGHLPHETSSMNIGRWSEAGALTTAGTAAATIFCCLPFASGVVGASVAAAGARLAPLRSYFVVLSVAFLGYACYQVYRRESPHCRDTCDMPITLRRRRLAFWTIAVLVASLLTASWWANWIIYWTL